MIVNKLPASVTTLDLLKSFAVICMIIDHIGFYFFPDAAWFRVVGRMGGAPIWFFLIGYASSRDVPIKWWGGALILAAADMVLFQSVFAVNVLVTLALLRLIIDHVMTFVMQSRYMFWLCAPLLALAYIPTNMVLEYGSMAVLSGIFGYMTRHRQMLIQDTFLTLRDYWGFSVFLIVMNTLLQSAAMGFNQMQATVLFMAFAAITVGLSYLRVDSVPQITNPLAVKTLHLGGRRTLEIYVAHLIVFKVVFFALMMLGFYH